MVERGADSVRQVLEIWRLLGAAIAALLLGASQLDPNPLPVWVFPVVAGIALLSVAVPFVVERLRRQR
jgi:hypothetical protein